MYHQLRPAHEGDNETYVQGENPYEVSSDKTLPAAEAP